MANPLTDDAYRHWLTSLKSRIQTSQIKAAVAVNSELILLYWELGRQIVEKQVTSKWGSGLIDRLAKDLRESFPDMAGFSRSNLYNIKQFFLFYTENQRYFNAPIVQQVVGQLDKHAFVPAIISDYVAKVSWGHNLYTYYRRVKRLSRFSFYLKETITSNWSSAVLQMQMESRLHERQGKVIANFEYTLPKPQSDLARQLLKDPYNFDFLTLEKQVQEWGLEKSLSRIPPASCLSKARDLPTWAGNFR